MLLSLCSCLCLHAPDMVRGCWLSTLLSLGMSRWLCCSTLLGMSTKHVTDVHQRAAGLKAEDLRSQVTQVTSIGGGGRNCLAEGVSPAGLSCLQAELVTVEQCSSYR